MPPTPIRGDVWEVDFGEAEGYEQAGKRPAVVILRHDLFEVTHPLITIAIPITTQTRWYTAGCTVKLTRGDGGLKADSIALCHHIRVIDCKRLLSKCGTLSGQKLSEIEVALSLLLGLPSLR